MENIPTLPAGSVMLQNGPLSLYHSSTDILAMERPIALTSSDIAALDINPSIAVVGGTNAGGGGHTNNIPPTLYSRLVSAASALAAGDEHSHHHHPHPHPHHHHQLVAMGSGNSGLPPANFSVANVATYPKPQYMNSSGVIGTAINPSENGQQQQQLFSLQQQQQLQAPAGPNSINPAAVATSMMSSLGKSHMFPPVIPFHETAVRPVGVGDQTLSQDQQQQQQQHAATAAQLLSLGATALLGRVGKNPGFFFKTQPSGFFWVFFVFLYICLEERGVFRVFTVSRILFIRCIQNTSLFFCK